MEGSLFGAQPTQPVATGRKRAGAEAPETSRNHCRGVATSCRKQRMVRRDRRFESVRGLPGSGPDSVLSVKVTAEAARRFLVARYLLAAARSLEGAVLEVFRRFGSIQFDPLAVAGRNHGVELDAAEAHRRRVQR